MSDLARYWHTLRYLRPVQFWGRLWFRAARPRPCLRPAEQRRQESGQWLACERAPSMSGPRTFRFLNRTAALESAGPDSSAELPLLWRYNLHYFDDLATPDAAARKVWHEALLRDWLAAEPPGAPVSWDPYPSSLRLVNWIKWQLTGHTLSPEAVHSLAVQTRWLRKRLEIHLQGNHLWANAKALVFAGAFFEGPEAEAWLRKGLRLIERELREQLLADGGHFERSPMYHAIVLEDLLDLIQLGQRYPGLFAQSRVLHWHELSEAMLRWLQAMSHPDGEIAFFNDATQGIAPNVGVLRTYARTLGLQAALGATPALLALEASGYVRAEEGAALLLADVGDIGPDYLPGHAHADTLSFELSLFGQRCIVNSGIDRYGADAERLRQRGSAAHSTVTVEDLDSSEVWGGFRVARRARAFGLALASGPEGQRISGSHDGYRRLPGKVIHERQWRLSPGRLELRDRLSGRFRKAVAHFHLHPAVGLLDQHPGGCTLSLQGRTIRLDVAGGQLSVTPGSYHPAFGKALPTQVLHLEFHENLCHATFAWTAD